MKVGEKMEGLASESVEGSSLSFQRIHDIHGGDGLSLGMLGVGHGISDDVLQEHLEDTAGFLIDETRNSLHASSSSQTTNGGLGDTLDVISQHLAMALGSSLPQPLSSFASSRHDIGSEK